MNWFRDLADTMKILVIGIIVMFVVGAAALAWVTVFNPMFQEQRRQQFQESQTHQDAVVQEFADNCNELATATDPTVRRAITAVIAQRAAVEKVDELQMNDVVRTCVNNAIKEYNSGNK